MEKVKHKLYKKKFWCLDEEGNLKWDDILKTEVNCEK